MGINRPVNRISDHASRLRVAYILHPKSNVPEHDDRSWYSAPVSNAGRPCSGGHRTSVVAGPLPVPLAVAAYMPAAAGQPPAAEAGVRFAVARTMPSR
jgi:hypothetical protein